MLRLSAALVSGALLGCVVTGASAGIPGPARNAFQAATPLAMQKVHESKGGIHTNECRRHPPPGQYLDCHTHFKMPNGTWVIRGSLPGGPPTVYCPKDCRWVPAPPPSGKR
jgi:hypothetical protein